MSCCRCISGRLRDEGGTVDVSLWCSNFARSVPRQCCTDLGCLKRYTGPQSQPSTETRMSNALPAPSGIGGVTRPKRFK
jgi:hypothetical protein